MGRARASRSLRTLQKVSFQKTKRRDARDDAFLQHFRAIAPWHDAVRGTGEELRACNQCRPAVAVESPKHIGPGAVAADGGARPARAVGKAAHATHADAQAFGRTCGGRGELRTRPLAL